MVFIIHRQGESVKPRVSHMPSEAVRKFIRAVTHPPDLLHETKSAVQ